MFKFDKITNTKTAIKGKKGHYDKGINPIKGYNIYKYVWSHL